MKKCLIVAMVVCLGMAGSAWATPDHGALGPGDPHTWEEDFEDNIDPADASLPGYAGDFGWRSAGGHQYTVEGGMMRWDGSAGFQQMETLPPNYNNGFTRIDIIMASDSTLGPRANGAGGDDDDEGVGLWGDVGSDPDGPTGGQSTIIVQLGWDSWYSAASGGLPGETHAETDARLGVPAHASGPTIRFGRGGGGSFTDVAPIHVANVGTVRVQMDITALPGDGGADVVYKITDGLGVVTEGTYNKSVDAFNYAGPGGKTLSVINFGEAVGGFGGGGSRGAIDYLKIANFPDGPPPVGDGDFDLDGDVDGADFLDWQRNLGDATNLGLWQDNFGNVSSVANVSGVPEPSSAALLGLMLVGLATRRLHRN